MKAYLFITMVAALGLVVGCSDDDNPPKNDKGITDTAPPKEAGSEQGTTDKGPTADTTPAAKVCQVYCDTKADCGTGYAACENHKCLMCKTNADCPTATYKGGCNTTTNTCMMCATNADCPATTYKGGCNTTTGVCKMCGDDTHCKIATTTIMTGKCDTTSGMCYKCATDTDCTGFTGSVYKACGASNVCVMCKDNSHCSTSTTYKGCDSTYGVCMKCTANEECCNGHAGCGLTCSSSGKCECSADTQCDTAWGTTVKYKCL